MKILPVLFKLFQPDGQTDMTKLTVAFCNFANGPKSEILFMLLPLVSKQCELCPELLHALIYVYPFVSSNFFRY